MDCNEPEPEFFNKSLNKVLQDIESSSESVIKNPFCMNVEGVSNKFFCDERLRSNRYNTNFIKPLQINKNEILLNNELDESLSYTICIDKKNKEPDGIDEEILQIDSYDYEISAEHLNNEREHCGKKPIHKEGLPISFCQIDNIEDGIGWYQKNYPMIPDELLPIISRYHWGDNMNKYTCKKERKKYNQKSKSKRYNKGTKIIRSKHDKGNYEIKFD